MDRSPTVLVRFSLRRGNLSPSFCFCFFGDFSQIFERKMLAWHSIIDRMTGHVTDSTPKAKWVFNRQDEKYILRSASGDDAINRNNDLTYIHECNPVCISSHLYGFHGKII